MRRIGIAVWESLVTTLAGLPAGVQAQGDDDGLVAEWHFDEVSVSVVKDSSGNGNNGVIHGATWADGVDYGLFGDAVSESGEARDIVHRAFTGLVDAGGCKIRWIEGAGMGVERVVG